MSINFQLEIDKETVAAFLEDVNDISQDIEVDVSRLIDDNNFDYHLQNVLDKLNNLEIHANGSALFPIAESIEIISNILKNTRQHHAIIDDAFIDIIYVMIDRITAMAENVIHEQSIPFEMFTLFQYLGMLLLNINENNFQKAIKDAKHYISNTTNIVTTETYEHDQDTELFGDDDSVELFGDDDDNVELFGDDDTTDDNIELFGETDANDKTSAETTNAGNKIKSTETSEPIQQTHIVPSPLTPLQSSFSLEEVIKQELLQFRMIAASTDDKCYSNISRSFFIQQLSLGLNEQAGKPVNEDQLKAAILMHDFGMLTLPDNFFQTKRKLNDDEIKRLKGHPELGYKVLKNNPIWKEAAQMVIQHHERPDGKGYPANLKEHEIHDGANIIAIVDAFFSMTHSNRTHERSYLRAAAEINACSGTQFCEHWVQLFNIMLRDTS